MPACDFSRGDKTFVIERLSPSKSIVDFDSTLSLLVESYISSETNNWCMGYSVPHQYVQKKLNPLFDETSDSVKRRVDDLSWLYAKVLKLYALQKPEIYRVRDKETRKQGESVHEERSDELGRFFDVPFSLPFLKFTNPSISLRSSQSQCSL